MYKYCVLLFYSNMLVDLFGMFTTLNKQQSQLFDDEIPVNKILVVVTGVV